MKLIYEKSQAGRRAGTLARNDLPVPELPAELRRTTPPRLPAPPRMTIHVLSDV